MTYACRVDDVPLGEGRALTLGDRRIALFRTPGAWYALDAICPHRSGPLADGIVCDRAVICPLHERRFDLATGAPLSAGEGVRAHAVEVRGDLVYVALAGEQRRAA
ncbi:MAG: nitrite reductase small subunit NirD [Solirubrobacteraceae bacterium]